MKRKNTEFIGARIPTNLKNLIVEYIKRDTHMNESDFFRAAIREKLRRDAPELYEEMFREAKTRGA